MSICVHCGCEGNGTSYGNCEHCTPKEYLEYKNKKKNIKLKSEAFKYDLTHYDEYYVAIYKFNKHKPKDVKALKSYDRKWLKRFYNKAIYDESFGDNLCVCRILMKHAKILAHEFGFYIEFISTEVPKNKQFKEFKLTDKVSMYKYYTHHVKPVANISDYIRHNVFLQGKEKDVKDILSRTCGVDLPRGCFIPVFV